MKKIMAACGAAFLLLVSALFVPIHKAGATSTNTNLWSVWIQNSQIDNTVIGANTPAAATFTTATASAFAGNASTATALAATPGQCAAGKAATGIQANGTANCSFAFLFNSQGMINYSLCTPSNSTDSQCTGSVTIPSAYADTGYGVVYSITDSGSSVPQLSLTITSKSTGSFTYALTCTFFCGSVGAPTGDFILYHP